MRDIALDFQPARPGLLSAVLLLAGALLCGDAWLEYDALHERQSEVDSRLALAKRRADRVEVSQRDSKAENVFSPEETKALQIAITAIQVDWEKLYHAIDAATSEDVSLLAIRPSMAGKSVQIAGEARDMAATLAFVEALKQEPLAKVVLISHQIKQNDAQHPIIFEIAATWLTGS